MKAALAVAVSLSLASLARAEAPANISAARVETRDGAPGLRAAVGAASASGPVWVGYAVETSSTDGSACCWSSHRDAGSCCSGCRLEGKRGDDSFNVARTSTALEGPRRLHVLLRVERGRIHKIRAFSQDCAIDVEAAARSSGWTASRAPTASRTWERSSTPTVTTRASATCPTAR